MIQRNQLFFYLDRLIQPSIFIVLFLSYYFGYLNINYLLNDEIIFDLVLLTLILFIHQSLSRANYKSTREDEDRLIQLTRYILYYLVTFRYFLIRKKKDQDRQLIQLTSYIERESSSVFDHYIDRVHSNMINQIRRNLYFRLRIISNVKRVELLKSIESSYKNKLFILC
jgi:hypothetical protein